MAFIGGNELRKILKNNIETFKEEMLEGASYHLTLGDEAFVTNSNKGKKILLSEANPQLDISPGQFALLLINEKIKIPYDKLAFIALRFKYKVKGLVNISGFHVDPGFSGKLIYAVYNAGANTIVLERGKPYFSIWISDLIGSIPKEKKYDKEHDHQDQDNIPPEYIEALKGDLASPNVLLKKINKAGNLIKNQTFVLGIIAAALSGICINLFWTDNKYKNGYIDGINDKEAIQRVDKFIRQRNIDSLINAKADSIVVLKGNQIKKIK